MKKDIKIGDECIVVNVYDTAQYSGKITKISKCWKFLEVRRKKFIWYEYNIVGKEYVILF